MTPQDAMTEITRGQPKPVYLLVGEEAIWSDRIVAHARHKLVDASLASFNVDILDANEASIDTILQAPRIVPMMDVRRLVIVRNIEKFEKSNDETPGSSAKQSPIDRLAEYVSNPVSSTCFLLIATKLDGRRKLMNVAKKLDILVSCEPLKTQQLGPFIREETKQRGHTISHEVAQLIADLCGSDLAILLDAVERLSLYVGPSAAITEEAVHACIARVRIGSIWGLSDAVVNKDRAIALQLLNENFDPRDRGLPLLGLLVSSMRKLFKMHALLAHGVHLEEAGKQSGIPPFKVRDIATQAKKCTPQEIEHTLKIFMETDIALKSSRRSPLLILEEMIVQLTVNQRII